MPRVAFVTNVLAHYRLPCFSSLAGKLREHIAFFFLTENMSHRGYVVSKDMGNLPATWLKGLKWHRPPNDDRHLNNITQIAKSRNDVIVMGGWDEPTYLLLWLWAITSRQKVLFWIESTAYDTYNGPHRKVKEYYKRLLLRNAAGCSVPGKRAFEYCSTLGMSESKIFVAPNATDRAYFSSQADRLRPHRNEIRGKLGIEGIALVFVGRLVEEHKNVSTLINAFGKLASRGESINLIVVGDGPDRVGYESIVAEHRIPRVYFLGELNHDQLCEVYSAADILVLPSSSEAWGFVLNEGMEFGLPLVVSEAVGAGPDLVHPGENGFVFPVGDSDKLAEMLSLLVRDDSLRERMGKASKKIIQDFTPEAWASGMVKAIEAVTGKTVNSPLSVVGKQLNNHK
jgi:glycosyltransferase involved in cell wall biosynthesis